MPKPESCRYAKTHEWVCVEGDSAVMGISDHAQGEITDVVYVDLPKPGRKLKKGESCGVLESVKAAFDIYSPVSGEVVSVNEALAKDPALVNRSAQGDGWFMKIKLEKTDEALALMDHQKYQEFLKTPEAHAGH